MNSYKTFNMKDGLSDGNEGERFYLECHKGLVEKISGREADFRLISDNKKIELKTENYVYNENIKSVENIKKAPNTPNFCVELVGNIAIKPITFGGPIKAIKDGCYIYQFQSAFSHDLWSFFPETLHALTLLTLTTSSNLYRSLRSCLNEGGRSKWLTINALIPVKYAKEYSFSREKLSLDEIPKWVNTPFEEIKTTQLLELNKKMLETGVDKEFLKKEIVNFGVKEMRRYKISPRW